MVKASISSEQQLKKFFARDIAQKATQPLKNGIEIEICIDKATSLTLTKINNSLELLATPPKNADMSFWIGSKGVEELVKCETEDIGEVGIAIIKLMLASDPDIQLKSKVHIGTLKLISHGY